MNEADMNVESHADFLLACYRGDIGAMRALSEGGGVCPANFWICWQLWHAVSLGQEVISNGAGTVKAGATPTNPLIQAAYGNQTTAILWLLETAKHSPSALEEALAAAVRARAGAAAALLVSRGADPLELDPILLPMAVALGVARRPGALREWSAAHEAKYRRSAARASAIPMGHIFDAEVEGCRRRIQGAESEAGE